MSGSDYGTGVFLGGPPPFVGGQNTSVGVIGGFIQAGPPSPPWSAYQEGCWNETPEPRCEGASPEDNGIWHDLRTTDESPTAFNNSIDPALIDNGAGVEWDQYRSTGLAPNGQASFTIINRTQVPGGLQISPANQTLTQRRRRGSTSPQLTPPACHTPEGRCGTRSAVRTPGPAR